MLAFSVVDVIRGVAARHFVDPDFPRKIDLSVASYQEFYMLDTDYVALPPKTNPELFQIVRRQTTKEVLTWIGIYTSMPERLNGIRPRPGNYCGAGLWFLEERFDSDRALKLLRRIMSKLLDLIEAERTISQWNITELDFRDFQLAENIFAELKGRRAESPREIGTQSVCVDLTEQSRLEDYIERIQTDGRLDVYRNLLLSKDPVVIAEIRRNGRIDVVTSTADVPGPAMSRRPAARAGQLAPTIAGNTVPIRPLTRNYSMSEMDLAVAKIDKLEQDLARLNTSSKANVATARNAKLSLLWNGVLTFALIAGSIQLYAPIAEEKHAPQSPPPPSPSSTSSGIGLKGPQDGPTKNDCIGHEVDCASSQPDASMPPDWQELDDAANLILDTVEAQAIENKLTAKQYPKLKELLARLKGDADALHDMAVKTRGKETVRQKP